MMKYYYHAWPINAFLKQYLGSSAAKYRRDIQKLQALDEIPSRQVTATPDTASQNAEDFVSFSASESGVEDSGDELEIDDRTLAASAKVSF